ncbi:hypothetical protein FBZ96_101390 [Bradyrhizobium stylosanthis]|uniref:Uncharacterized protein n=1 Tax=Bradyrhizobium stylosanthis TaxID=1803665 RepID=A0A560EB50_9BRAD|nr:hypothetical protein FBZ96_101390 [Bradyrhizobium stylosanthis]
MFGNMQNSTSKYYKKYFAFFLKAPVYHCPKGQVTRNHTSNRWFR